MFWLNEIFFKLIEIFLCKMGYDCKVEAANRLVDKIRHWISEPEKAKAGIFCNESEGPILKAYHAVGITDIAVSDDVSDFFDRAFDVFGISLLDCPPDEALYLVYDLFRQRRFSGTSLLCTNFSGELYTEYLRAQVRKAMSQTSFGGHLMNVDKADQEYFRDNLKGFPLTSTLMLCSRPEHKLVCDILDVDYEPDKEPVLNLPPATQLRQAAQQMTMCSKGGFTTKVSSIQCTFEQGEQLIYAAFSDKPMPYTVQDAANFVYRDGGTNVYWDILLISDCVGIINEAKPLVKGKDSEHVYVINGSGKQYGINIRTFSELAKKYDFNLRKKYSLISRLNKREDITLPYITLNEVKLLLQDGVPPETILQQHRGVTGKEMQSLKDRFYARPEKAVAVTNNDNKTDSNGKPDGKDETIAKAREIIARGVLLYDSNLGRVLKNASRIQFDGRPKTTTHIKNFPDSLEIYSAGGIYVINSYDIKCEEALDFLLNLYLKSSKILNLVFLGESFNKNDINDATELGVKIRFTHVPITQAYIDEKQPINLEKVVASML